VKRFFIILFFFLIAGSFNVSYSNNYQQDIRLFPTNWWVGMTLSNVQLIVKGGTSDFNLQKVTISYPGVELRKIHRLENKKYYALDVHISPTAKPGIVTIKIGDIAVKWPLGQKNKKGNGITYARGATCSDLMYLIMPDRFSNGDYSNDRIPGMRDQSLNRDTVFNRHGGDLQGIINHLDYFNQLGVTTLWLNPVLTNDMPERTEHGYAFTDHYTIDPRLGGNQAYKDLIQQAHQKNIKIIQDAVYNHIGTYHWIVQDPPASDWLHQWPQFQQTSYKDQTLMDPYASAIDKKIMSDGWFVRSMPDLNQRNSFVAKFLIQHAIWCVEEFGIDGWRIDTYAYNDLDFMNECNAALMKEYPKLSLFGETWVHGVINQSYFTRNNYNIPYKSNLPGVTDFQLLWAINDVMTKPFGWTDGVNKMYSTLAQDFVYADPYNNVVFLDNHDLSRAYSVYNKDLKKYKMALTWLLTCRGIPQLYYGNEVLMEGVTSPNDGYVRLDFPGGWKEDKVDKFNASGRTPEENEVWNLISKLAHFRQNSKALTTGKMMQFAPDDGLYVYFRYNSDEVILCVMNSMDKDKNYELQRYNEMTKGFSKGINILDDSEINLNDKIFIKSHSMQVILLKK
jgi:glycosidase